MKRAFPLIPVLAAAQLLAMAAGAQSPPSAGALPKNE